MITETLERLTPHVFRLTTTPRRTTILASEGRGISVCCVLDHATLNTIGVLPALGQNLSLPLSPPAARMVIARLRYNDAAVEDIVNLLCTKDWRDCWKNHLLNTQRRIS